MNDMMTDEEKKFLEAVYDQAYAFSCRFEGGWGNHPADSGGETYRGIARNYHRNWPGWPIIDAWKAKSYGSVSILDKNLAGDDNLQAMIKSFYRQEFFDACGANKIALLGAGRLAEKHFDFSVNAGYHDNPFTKYWIEGSVGVLQLAANAAMPPEKKTAYDGDFGGDTLRALKEALKISGEQTLLVNYCRFQKKYYLDIVAGNPSQQVFLQAWLGRADWIPLK